MTCETHIETGEMEVEKNNYLEFWGYKLGTPEAEEAWEAKLKMMYGPAKKSGHLVMTDGFYDGMQAPDGSDISTRTKHREYMRRTGLTTTDDFKSEWKQQAEARANYMERGGTVSRDDVARAMCKHFGV